MPPTSLVLGGIVTATAKALDRIVASAAVEPDVVGVDSIVVVVVVVVVVANGVAKVAAGVVDSVVLVMVNVVARVVA